MRWKKIDPALEENVSVWTDLSRPEYWRDPWTSFPQSLPFVDPVMPKKMRMNYGNKKEGTFFLQRWNSHCFTFPCDEVPNIHIFFDAFTTLDHPSSSSRYNPMHSNEIQIYGSIFPICESLQHAVAYALSYVSFVTSSLYWEYITDL